SLGHSFLDIHASHSMPSSASARNGAGTVRSIALAVLRLMTNSTFADCSTGRPAGFVPRRILLGYSAGRRYMLEKFMPEEKKPPTSMYSRKTKLVGSRFSFASCTILVGPRKMGAGSHTLTASAPGRAA